MRLLIVDPCSQNQVKYIYVGGRERIGRIQAMTLSNVHDVHFLTASGSQVLEEGYSQHWTKVPAKHEGQSDRNWNKNFHLDVLEVIGRVDPEVVVFHHWNPFSASNRAASFERPCVFYEHSCPEYMGRLFNNVGKFHNLCENLGYVMVSVSQFQADKFAKKFGYEIFDTVNCGMIVDYGEEILPEGGYGLVVCRWDPLKGPHRVLDLMGEYSLKIHTTSLSVGKSGDYSRHIGGIDHEIIYDQEYTSLWDSVRDASFTITTYPDESSGLISGEGAMRGIPSVLFCRNGRHAAEEHLRKSDTYLFDVSLHKKKLHRFDVFQELLKSIDMRLETRKSLAKYMQDEFSKEDYIENFGELLDSAIRKYQMRQRILF